MAQGGYQQLAKQVMSNGGSMQDAGRLWQAAGKNLQRAQQMLRKGGNNKRNMRGGSDDATSGIGASDAEGDKADQAIGGSDSGEADLNAASDSPKVEEKDAPDVSNMMGMTSMFGGKRRRNSRKNNNKRNMRGGSDVDATDSIGASDTDGDKADQAIGGSDSGEADLTAASDSPKVEEQDAPDVSKMMNAMTGMLGGKRRSQKKRNNNNRKGGKKQQQQQSRKGGKKQQQQSRKGGKNNRRN